ncbi:MAG: class I SAM-dependent methyltransferase [Saprospiraceae bacterium]|nr:class I SAM-dependent methyltransferase [Saprospiraceae bacterium]
MQFLKQYPVKGGVYFLKEPDDTFERVYLKARQIEGRINNDDVVIHLPGMQKDASLKDEWKWRENSCKRFVRYFKQYPGSKVLDLGCGNGWFTNQLAKNVPGQYLGLDINSHELYQAARMFSTTHCRFAYGDIFSQPCPSFFDMIILNASIQYFQSLPRLIERCRLLLTVHGQIHILDSPFYTCRKLQNKQDNEANHII